MPVTLVRRLPAWVPRAVDRFRGRGAGRSPFGHGFALLARFPRAHLHVAAGVGAGTALMLTSALWTGGDRPHAAHRLDTSSTLRPVPAVAPIEIPPAPAKRDSAPSGGPGEPGQPEVQRARAPADAEPPWRVVTVREGDSLARIFQREGLSPASLFELMDSGRVVGELRRIHPGDELLYRTGVDDKLLELRYHFSPLEYVEARRPDPESDFEARRVELEPERRERFAEAEIQTSLFVASKRAGLPTGLTMQLAYIFQWDIDFILDIRKGDSFHVLYEEQYLDGERIGHGPIVAAEFVNRGERHRAVRYVDSEGDADYYGPDGRSMRKAFLRAPVQFTRVSSSFNLRRRHPVHKRVMPHRGIDYAAPTGTPVLAAGDGRVTTVKRHHASGNYIVIRHSEQYQTKYLHLSRFAKGMRPGKRVRQGDVIGYVGATGWATGPHLHYEFLLSGVHRNPRTVPLPKAEPIPEGERQRFQAATQPLLAELRTLSEAERVALNDDGG